ncbi:MAG: hypothetical protein FWB85_10700 [Chitinispirillia bacterium]|nr:hypothetical protein [Chitinispirillia bacterium]
MYRRRIRWLCLMGLIFGLLLWVACAAPLPHQSYGAPRDIDEFLNGFESNTYKGNNEWQREFERYMEENCTGKKSDACSEALYALIILARKQELRTDLGRCTDNVQKCHYVDNFEGCIKKELGFDNPNYGFGLAERRFSRLQQEYPEYPRLSAAQSSLIQWWEAVMMAATQERVRLIKLLEEKEAHQQAKLAEIRATVKRNAAQQAANEERIAAAKARRATEPTPKHGRYNDAGCSAGIHVRKSGADYLCREQDDAGFYWRKMTAEEIRRYEKFSAKLIVCRFCGSQAESIADLTAGKGTPASNTDLAVGLMLGIAGDECKNSPTKKHVPH